jgi:SAM-dependent methyltransferase
MIDWGVGEYERTAAQLAPAATAAVAALAPQAGERILDVGCGTGNAALLIAGAGATVVGVDPARRLLEVARERARDANAAAEFVQGEGAALPADDTAFDAAISVFGVIFADAEAAAGELVRVVRPGGRIVLTTWVPSGPINDMNAVVREALGAPAQPPTWSDPDVVRELFAGHEVQFIEHAIPFTAASPQAYIDDFLAHHPMALSMEGPLRASGRAEEVGVRALEIFTAANEDPSAFRTTSRYWVVEIAVG